MNHHGKKNVTDPEAQEKPINEGVGLVTKDSLAAESEAAGGGFGKGNPKAAASDQPSFSTTSNVTDTSAAEELSATSDRPHRKEKSEDILDHPKQHTETKSHPDSTAERQSSTEQKGATQHEQIDQHHKHEKSKSARKTNTSDDSKDFDYDHAHNASFEAEIGSKDDPSRLAEDNFVARNQKSILTAGQVEGKLDKGGSQYDVLKEETE